MKKTLILIIIIIIKIQLISAQDAKFKTLIMYNFTKLIDWPSKDGNFTIYVLGSSDIIKELKSFTTNRKAGGIQTIEVKEIVLNEVGNCNILFIPSSESGNLQAVITKLNGSKTLLITEKSGLTKKGAGISFINEGGTWKYEFNEGNITNKGLKVSSDFKQLGIAK